jgi:hypothetical protein
MANTNILSQTCVKINNTYFDITEGSFKIKKGYGSKEKLFVTSFIRQRTKLQQVVLALLIHRKTKTK